MVSCFSIFIRTKQDRRRLTLAKISISEDLCWRDQMSFSWVYPTSNHSCYWSSNPTALGMAGTLQPVPGMRHFGTIWGWTEFGMEGRRERQVKVWVDWPVIGRQDSLKPWLRSPGIQWGKCGKTWPRATGFRGPGGCQFTEHQAAKGFALGKSWAENYWLLTLEGSNFFSVLINNQIVLKPFKVIWNFLITGEIDRVT